MNNSFLLICLLLFVLEANPFLWRRRRRACRPVNCRVGSWTDWGSCSRECGTSGERERTRPVVQGPACGGICYSLKETESCNRYSCHNGGSPYSNGCSCTSGFTGTCCEDDVNECRTTSPCENYCYNTPGSYRCSCYSCYTKVGTRCYLRQCKISSRCYTYGDVNPSNPCQDCNIASKTSWRNNNALPCNDNVACTRKDRCSSGKCVGTPFSCLWCEECYNDACRIKPGYCVNYYQGVRKCFYRGTLRPGYPCQQCDSNRNTQWTKNNNLQCSDNNLKTKDDRCTNGACVGTPYNCLSCETHDGSGCPIKSGYCVIHHRGQRTCFARYSYKPGNPCQWCYPSWSSTSTWSNRVGVVCDDGDKCTRGDSCRRGLCTATPFTCNSLCQYCNGNSCSLKTGFGFVSNKCTCKIAAKDYSHQAINPSNQCQWCNLNDARARANSAWTNRPAVACNDYYSCTKQDTCSAGRCVGKAYSCQSSYPSSSCIKTSQCVGDGTCRHFMRPRTTICRRAVDICDQPERCDGRLGTCPGAVTNTITLTTGTVKVTDQTFQTSVAYQYFTDKLHLKISGFSASCGHLTFRWFVLSGASACSVASSINGTFSYSSTQQTLTRLTLHNDNSYKVSIQALDMRGNHSPQLVCSGVITIDTSKPQGGWIRDGPGADLSYQASKRLQVNWGGVQTTHGVGKYEWKVVLTSFQSKQAIDLMPFTNVNLNTNANKVFNSVTDGSKARFVVRAYTKAGRYRDLTSDGVVIDTSPPVASQINDGNQAGLDETLSKWTNTYSANWGRFTDAHSPVSRYSWAVKRHGAGSFITSFRNTALNRSPRVYGLNLVSGESYCAIVRGYNEAGQYSQVTSDCVLIDHNAPRPGTVNDGYASDIDYQSENTIIAANWNGFTDGTKGSGIVEYRYKITDAYGSTIVAWTTAGNATKIANNGLDLKHTMKYVVTVKAVDAVGLSTDVTSDGVTVDTTHPVFTGKVIVTGENDVINGTPCVYVFSTSSVTVQWVGFHDAHSGLQRYDWAIVPSDTSPSSSDFKEVPGPNLPTTATFTGLALTQGKAYYVIIRAYNKAKLYKDALSVLVIPDSTPPSPGKVFDGPTPGVDIDYQANLTYVYGTWTSFPEPQTSVKQYYYAVGSCIMGNYHVTGNAFVQLNPATATSFILTNIKLMNGQQYCIKVKAENKAGLLSSEVSSDGFVADVTLSSFCLHRIVNGGWSKWSTWTSCTKTCGLGTQERSRSCTQPPPGHGGKPCLGTTRQKRVCNTNPCPVDGGWSSWSGWKSCSKTCGAGNQDRVRTCTRPAPKNGGKPCPGTARDNRVCNTNACPVDGNWSDWSSWRPCSKTCGSGKQFRSRSCTNPTPQNGGKICRGEARDEQGCNTRPCPVDGGWSVWGAWSPCDKSCGGGFRQRTRSCVNPPPAFGGKGCGTANHESSTCNLDSCSVDGAWSNWGNWSECSVTCGTGARSRDRLCDNPLPAAGGKPCEGNSQDSMPCTTSEVCLVGVGCYGNFPTLFPDFLGNFRDEIEWFAPSFAEEIKKVVKKCGQLASKERLRFFAVEDFGKCYGDLSQDYGFGSDSKSSRCNFGVGLPNYYYVYMVGA